MDAIRPEPEHHQVAELPGDTLRSTLGSGTGRPEQNRSPETRPSREELPVTSSNHPAYEQGGSASSLGGQAEAGTASATQLSKVSFPRLRSSAPPTDAPFGAVSSSGQLVCDFNHDAARRSPPPEEKIVGSSSMCSEPKTLSGSVSPPPQASNRIEVAHPNKTVSTLELSVDHGSYPEVYVPEHPAKPEPDSPPRIATPEAPMDRGISSAASGDFSPKTGYLENSHMSMRNLSNVPLVTPIHLLGDQSDYVDCPFCTRRVETMVKKKASSKTHVWGSVCFFTTFFGVFVPYRWDWYSNMEHHCTNCKRKIAQRRYNTKEFTPLGTHPELKEVSRFESTEKRDGTK